MQEQKKYVRNYGQPYEGAAAKVQLSKIESYAKKLGDMIHEQDDLEPWVQDKLSMVTYAMADIKHYMDKILADAGQSLHRDDIDELLTQEYEAYEAFRRVASETNWSALQDVHEKVKNYELEEEAQSGLHDYTFKNRKNKQDHRHVKAHNLKEARDKAQDVYKKGGDVDNSTMWRVKPSTMAEDMIEARGVVGNDRWNAMSRDEQKKTTEYLRFQGVIGLPGQEENIEDVSALQYYKKGGRTESPYEEALLEKGFEKAFEIKYKGFTQYRKGRWYCWIDDKTREVEVGKFTNDVPYKDREGGWRENGPYYHTDRYTYSIYNFKKFLDQNIN